MIEGETRPQPLRCRLWLHRWSVYFEMQRPYGIGTVQVRQCLRCGLRDW